MLRVAPPLALLGSLLLTGCVVAPPSGPNVMVLPAQGKNLAEFQQDEVTCRQYAAQMTGIAPQEAATQSGVGSAAVGTVLGAAAGAAIGAAAGNPGAGAAIGAGSGLLLGGASGVNASAASGAQAQYRYDTSYVQCMAARGNQVPMPAQQPVAAAPPAGYAPQPAYPPPVVAYPAYPPPVAYPYPYYYPAPAYGYYGHRHYWR